MYERLWNFDRILVQLEFSAPAAFSCSQNSLTPITKKRYLRFQKVAA